LDRSSPRLRGDDGAVLVEFALIAPVLILLALGVMEFGFAWREVNRVERVVASAARVGASQADDKYTDYDILRTVDAALAGANMDVQRVVVWNAEDPDDPVPASCTALATGGINNLCNVYNATQVGTTSPGAGFPNRLFSDPANCTGGWDDPWCPITERERRRPLNDYVGVWIRATYEGVTGLVPTTLTIERSSVFAIEPCFEGDVNCD
jgi:hypothetical protein